VPFLMLGNLYFAHTPEYAAVCGCFQPLRRHRQAALALGNFPRGRIVGRSNNNVSDNNNSH
jgi:hypothetical protein